MLGGTVKGPDAPEDRTQNSPGQRCTARPSLEGAAAKAADPLRGQQRSGRAGEPGTLGARLGPRTDRRMAGGCQLAVSCLVPGGWFHGEDYEHQTWHWKKMQALRPGKFALNLEKTEPRKHLSTLHSARR